MNADFIKSIMKYDPKNGGLYWIKPTGARAKAGDRVGFNAGSMNYRKVQINNIGYMEHHLVWMLHHGSLSTLDIDHINGDTQDNRIENLREATRSQNLCNQKIRSDNKSGIKGVFFVRSRDKWCATIQYDGLKKHLGYFDSIDDAVNARKNAEQMIHKEFAWQGVM